MSISDNRRGKDEPTDLKTLSDKLTKIGIEHEYKPHRLTELEPQVLELIGYFPAGTHQIIIPRGDSSISIIRGSASFGDFELFGAGFEADRFETEEEVIEALKN